MMVLAIILSVLGVWCFSTNMIIGGILMSMGVVLVIPAIKNARNEIILVSMAFCISILGVWCYQIDILKGVVLIIVGVIVVIPLYKMQSDEGSSSPRDI